MNKDQIWKEKNEWGWYYKKIKFKNYLKLNKYNKKMETKSNRWKN